MQVTVTLRTLTPLFLAGADQQAAELRAPSFRGVMRYWLRASVGGIVGTGPDGRKKVADVEKAVFGATDVGSAVSIKVSPASDKAREFTEQTSVRVGGTWRATGKGYFLWSMAKSGKVEKGNLKPARWYFLPGTSFQATLSTRGTDAKLEEAIAAFWLLTHLGGIGSRSRRCAGSLAVQAVEGNTTNFLFNPAKNAQDLKLQLEQGIKEAKKIAIGALEAAEKDWRPQQQPIKQADFDILAPGVCRIWILQDEQAWSSSETAMEKLGASLQSYRGTIGLPQRKIFGLPLPPMIFNKRRASPLLLHVAELQEKKYVGIAVLFKTTDPEVAMGDYKFIERWINEFRGKQEVML